MNDSQHSNPDMKPSDSLSLEDLGWRAFFNGQLDVDKPEHIIPVRVVAVHRNELQVLGAQFDASVLPYLGEGDEDAATIGDWLMLDRETGRIVTRLDRISLFKRFAPGSAQNIQLIAANVDTLMIVSSCNDDFNVARLERYLAVAREAEVMPVVVLTKADQSDDADDYRRRAEKLMPNLCVETLDATDPVDVKSLAGWCGKGQTVAFVGSSGVGKSTLSNSLLGNQDIATQAVREDDAKGRHTTTHRALYRTPSGGWVLDSPGIRELQLTDVADGIAALFSDVEDMAAQCRFSDCSHTREPGCAVRAAIEAGELDPARLERWRKLLEENDRNSLSISQARAKARNFSKMVKRTVKAKPSR